MCRREQADVVFGNMASLRMLGHPPEAVHAFVAHAGTLKRGLPTTVLAWKWARRSRSEAPCT